ncbi:MAG: hypothetical protein ACYDCO_25795 [Armatimonadota bacterium]
MSEPAIIQAMRARLNVLEAQIPDIVESAKEAALATANPAWKVRFPSSCQPAFSDEFIARAGGLANWGTDKPGELPSPDAIFYAARSWEEDAAEAKSVLPNYFEHGWQGVLIGSRAGMPAKLPYDVFLDNGAETGGAAESPVNFIANITLGWMWVVEFAAALTRQGVHPHVLQSVFVPGAVEFNKSLTPTDALPPCETAVPAGELAAAYLRRIAWLLDDMARPEIQQPIAAAARLIRAQLRKRGRVLTACLAHAVPGEMGHAVKGPYINLGVPREADIQEKARPGDLVLFMGYVGVDNEWYAHGAWLRAAEVKTITSYIDDPLNPDNRIPDALAHIPQSWAFGDAEVEIPFPPGKMAPMSVVNQLLIFRMLDDAVMRK